MKQRLLFILSVSLFLAASAASQTRQITNADLEKYRVSRVQAEEDLRQNYSKLGFPSPEELDRQNAESTRQREELSARLRRERLEREQLEAERQRAAASAAQPIFVPNGNDAGIYYGFGLPSRAGGSFNRQRFSGGALPFGIGWRATPGGVIYEPGGRSSFIWTPTFTRVSPKPRPRRTGGSRRSPR